MSSTFAESIVAAVLESRNNSFYRCKNFRLYKIPRSIIQLCYSFLVENLNNSINSIKTFSSGELIAKQAFKKFPRNVVMPYPDSCLRKQKSQQIHKESIDITCHDFPRNPQPHSYSTLQCTWKSKPHFVGQVYQARDEFLGETLALSLGLS